MARRILAACASALALAVAISGCSSSKNSGAKAPGSASTSTAASGGGTVVIGSADFSESEVLANLYALLAQSAGYKTKIQTVTTREIYEPALEKGQLAKGLPFVLMGLIQATLDILDLLLNGSPFLFQVGPEPCRRLSAVKKILSVGFSAYPQIKQFYWKAGVRPSV